MVESFYLELSDDLEGIFLRFEASDMKMVKEYLDREYSFYDPISDSTIWMIPWTAILDHRSFSILRTHRITINAKCGPLERKEENADTNEG